ncbi:MAG: lysophospholipid acyltransferase family protein [Planctomycetaceae bacterium]
MTTAPPEDRRPADLSDPRHPNKFWRFCRFWLRNIFVFWLDYRSRGYDASPDCGALVVANHESFLDPFLVALPVERPISYLARHNLFAVPVIGTILRMTYVMPINRDSASSASIREAVRRINDGFYVGIFPEGTRSNDGQLGELKPGFIALLRMARSPVVPVGVAGAGRALPRGGLYLRRGKIRVVYGRTLEWTELEPLTKRGREADLLALIRERMLDVCGQAAAWRDSAA